MAVPPKDHNRKKRKKLFFLHLIGNLLILFSIFGVAATFGPALYYEAKFQISRAFRIEYFVSDSPKGTTGFGRIIAEIERQNPNAQESLFASIINGEKQKILVPVSAQFSVVIPKIGANENVYSNVDPSKEEEYLNVLRYGIAHAKGTAFPGVNGTTYLFAHSADNFWQVGRYNATFYLLNKMEKGDEVILFYNGVRHDYLVTETKIVEATDTHYIDSKLGEGEKVILQTCWPPGTAWKRLLVFAKPKK